MSEFRKKLIRGLRAAGCFVLLLLPFISGAVCATSGSGFGKAAGIAVMAESVAAAALMIRRGLKGNGDGAGK